MLEAFFGGLFAFAMQVTTKIIDSSIQIIRNELGQGRRHALETHPSHRRSIEAAALDLQEIDTEITDRRRSMVGRPNVADQSAIDNLLEQKKTAYTEYQELQQEAAHAELTESPGSFSQSSLVKGAENKLLFHTGLITLKKNCPKCSKPMRLQHKTVADPGFSDFFWQCTGFYSSDNQCRNTISFRPTDLSLVHKSGIPEIEIENSDLVTIASEESVLQSTDRRVKAHLGDVDVDVLCPVHLSPMRLRQKMGPDNMPQLDKFHLRCQNPECSQTTKLKSFPQLAAFLRRKDGDGILV
jgi:hypothetical protein